MTTKLKRDHPLARVYCIKEDHRTHYITTIDDQEKQYCTACGDFQSFYPTRQYRCDDSKCLICNECEVCKKESNNVSKEELERSIAMNSKNLEDLPQNLF